jgi:poly-gamma-glutamate synthesis protein (capsule biosynthesis protein)
LLTYAGDYNALVNLLGDTPGGDVISKTITIIDDDVKDISELLSQDIWALVPFDRLQPKYKVISIDGISPLDDAFSQHSYPLTGSYALYTSPDTFDRFPDANINLLKEGLPKTNRDENKITTLIMTGVTALVRATAYRMETMGITYPGLDIADWLQNADITHISNEVVFSEKCPYPDPISTSLAFCSKTDYLDLFTYVGADVIELTGNHINDTSRRFGDPFAFAETLALYDDHNMLYYGGGMDKNLAQQPAIIQHNGHKIAFIGCNSPGPDFAWAAEGQEGAAPCEDFTWLITEVERLKTEGYLPVVTIQYGEDYTNYASQKMKAEFQQIAASGAVIVNGSQAHTPKEFEFYQGSFIHYGLGNLFFDQMYTVINGISYPQTRWEFIQKHVFYNGKYLSTELLTAMLEDYSRPRPMTSEERQIFLQSIFSINQ